MRSARRLLVAFLALVGLLLAGVPSAVSASAATDHETGSTANGTWVLDVPANFNGRLLVWSHGYSFTPVTAANAPSAAVRDSLLADGYALIGSTYAGGGAGWAVTQGVAAGIEAIGIARTRIGAGRVTKVYAWGNSLGGLITETLAERRPDLVNGVAPLCGVLGGTNLNLDLALDAAVAVRQFFVPTLKLTGYTSVADATANRDKALAAIQAQLADPRKQPTAAARVLGISALLGSSAKTRDFSAATFTSAVSAAVESLGTALTYGTIGRYDIERRVGGNPSTNVGVDYRKRADAAAQARFAAFGFSKSLLVAYAQTLQTYGARVGANSTARSRANGLGNPTGLLSDRTVTLHTQYDPLVLVQNEKVFANRVGSQGKSALLRQLYVSPPSSYADGSPSSATDGAPYGAGHCNFETSHYLAVMRTLDTWVSTGTYTAPAATPGLLTSLAVANWPAR